MGTFRNLADVTVMLVLTLVAAPPATQPVQGATLEDNSQESKDMGPDKKRVKSENKSRRLSESPPPTPVEDSEDLASRSRISEAWPSVKMASPVN